MSDNVNSIPFMIEGRIIEGDEAKLIIQGLLLPFQNVIQEKNLVPVEIYYGVKAQQFGRKIRYTGTDPMVIYWIGYNHRDAILQNHDIYLTWFNQGEWEVVSE